MNEELLEYMVEIEGETLRLEDVPTWVCSQCDYTLVEETVMETVEDMLAHLDDVQAGLEEE
jgi:YgiT-type zinc finger domain-containing protein